MMMDDNLFLDLKADIERKADIEIIRETNLMSGCDYIFHIFFIYFSYILHIFFIYIIIRETNLVSGWQMRGKRRG